MFQAFNQINWLAVLACVVAGQVLLTVWFTVLFGEQWARAYGGKSMTRAQHTAEVPGYTYAIGAICVFLMSVGLAELHILLQIDSVSGALGLAAFLGVTIFVAMAMPAYAFLKRWNAFTIGAGSQLVLIAIVSMILVLWP